MRATPWPLATPHQASSPRRVSVLTTSRGGRGASSCRRQSNRELRKDTFWGLRRRGKARCVIPRQAKLRLSVRRRGQNAPFREASGAECAFPSRRGAREVWGNPPPGCGVPWKMAQLGKCARATARQPAGRLAPSSRNGDDHVCDRPHPSCASTRPLKSCGLVQTTATRVQTLTQEVPFSIAR